jgi:hypothetical protein
MSEIYRPRYLMHFPAILAAPDARSGNIVSSPTMPRKGEESEAKVFRRRYRHVCKTCRRDHPKTVAK